MLIAAKYPSVCGTCKKRIAAGERVSWAPGQRTLHAACSDEGKAVQITQAKSRATVAPDDVTIPVPEGRELLGYQAAGVAFALSRQGTLIADEMGLGKTVQAIGVINASPDVKTVLVVCPASLKLNWKVEIDRWCTRDHATDIFPERSDPGLYKIDCVITIINYDQLKKLPQTGWDLLVMDEAHYIKNPDAKRTKLMQSLAKKCKKKLLLTGTPILNKPVELWTLLQVTNPENWDPGGFYKGKIVGPGEGRGFFPFVKRYCDAMKVNVGSKEVWDFSGASNLDELQEKLRASCMVRRLKADVLRDLPPKRRQVVMLDVPASKNEEAAFVELGLDYETAIEQLQGKFIRFDKLSKARHDTALRKVPAAADHIREVLESTSKVVVFAHHKDVVQDLEDSLRDYNPVTITGDTVTEWRHEAVQRFQTDDSCRVIIGTIGAMGVGLTLTAASTVIFIELSWVPAELTQAEDRLHRIGQRESVLVQHLVAQRSIDANMIDTVLEKQEIADLALDVPTIEVVDGQEVITTAPEVDEERCRKALYGLRFLASACDGAFEKDGRGFNKLDSGFGKKLAALPHLSPRQCLAAEKMLAKYKKQLERFEP